MSSKILSRVSYDDAGRILRETNPDGSVVAFQYDPNGNRVSRHTSLADDPMARKTLATQEQALLKSIAMAGPHQQNIACEALADFYMDRMFDFKKALTLVVRVDPPFQYYIRMHALRASNKMSFGDA